jgi:hypothetical protein
MKKIIIACLVVATVGVGTMLPSKANAGSDDECGSCMVTRCENEHAACVRDSGCLQVVKCISGCEDKECLNACGRNRSVSSVNKAVAILTCTINNCKAACGN